MARYTIDSQVTYTTQEVSREEFLKFIESNPCCGLIRCFEQDNDWDWTYDTGLCVTDEAFDWENFTNTHSIKSHCITERLGKEGPQITEWNIIWSDEGYPIAQAVVGEWK